MKTIRTIATIAFTSLVSLGIQAQSTQRLNASKANDFGLIYSLPRTLVNITIGTQHTEKTPGEFYNYAKLKLGINDAITKPERSVRVKSVTITPRGVADPDNRS